MAKIAYLGVDETSLGIGSDSLIVVAAETYNKNLTMDKGINSLRKSKDLLRDAAANQTIPKFPTLDELRSEGLTNYHWTRAKGGRFSIRELQHASIAHVVQVNGYKPKSTVILIDAFYANYQKSQYLIHEYLHKRGFKIPLDSIQIYGAGDKCIPIINFADLLAFQIGLYMNERYRTHNPDRKKFDANVQEIEFDEQRVMLPLTENGRKTLEEVLKTW